MNGWTIKGEAGAVIDEFERPISWLGSENMSLSLANLAPDTFVWTVAMSNSTGAGANIPTIGQLIEVFHNGVRRFRGHVTIPRIGLRSVVITAEGPWWWLSRIYLTSPQTDGTGEETERPIYVFPTQDLATSFASLIDRLIVNGVPISRGTIADCFTFPRITLSEQSGAQALAALLAIIPDAVMYFDYSVSGLPALNIARRADMEEQVFTLGTDSVEDLDLAPRLDLEVRNVSIQSVTRRELDGKTQWAQATAGTSVTGKNQIVVVSGPEPNDYIPRDKNNSFALKSVVFPTSGTLLENVDNTDTPSYPSMTGDIADWIRANDPNAIKIKSKFPSETMSVSTGGRSVFTALSNGTGGTGIFTGRPELYSKIDITGKYFVVSPDRVPDWAASEKNWTVADATLDYHIYLFTTQPSGSGLPSPSWLEFAQTLGGEIHSGYVLSGGNYSSTVGLGAFWKGTLQAKIISVEYAALTTIYRPFDYDYINPPTDLAENLLLTQNWIPWEGRITTVADELTGTPSFNLRTNVANSLPDCASMGALTKKLTYDIRRGRKIIELGAPARVGFGTLASRFHSSRRDNIVNL